MGRVNEVFAPPPPWFQVLRRAPRVRYRTRPDGYCRAERLRQVEPCRGAALGDGGSYKNMRASGMDDVIFPVRERVRPATLPKSRFPDNSDRSAPAAFNDADELRFRAASGARQARSTASTARKPGPGRTASLPTSRPARVAVDGGQGFGELIRQSRRRAARFSKAAGSGPAHAPPRAGLG